MLIRSQDKTKLVDITGKTIAIDRANAIGITYANSNVLLGKYTSKEKALKVLDLIGQGYNNFETGFRCDVFQMPKDEEANEVYNKEYLEDINEKREKFAKEILDIACNGGVIAVTKDNKVVCCRDMNCEQCLFHKEDFCGGYCDDTERIRWFESEYVDKPTITSKDKMFLDLILSKWKYIARDKDKNLYVFDSLPSKGDNGWRIENILMCDYCNIFKKLFGDMFDFIKWEDEKPWIIEDLKKLGVKDE